MKDYFVLHFDEKWIHKDYIKKYTSIEPSFDEGICNDYSYQSDNLDGTREEGYFESTDDYSTTGKGTDFDINTDPEDIISEMEENKKDPTNRDEVMEWLQSNYKTE